MKICRKDGLRIAILFIHILYQPLGCFALAIAYAHYVEDNFSGSMNRQLEPIQTQANEIMAV